MRKIYLALLSLCFAAIVNAQISVTVTGNTNTTPNLAASYSSLAAAITDLNTVTSMTGPVLFDLTAGGTETTSNQLTITTAGNASYSITFQKSGGGANPKVTRTDAGSNATSGSTIGGLGDGIIRIDGTDNIIFDGLDLQADNQGIEYGYYTHKPSGTNGVQGLTIQNCTVTMTKGTSAYVIGIYIGNGASTVSSATGVTVTATSGENTSVTIRGNTIQNVHAGIVCRGGTGSYPDQDYTIGASGAGNTIQNFGGGSATSTYGVYFIYANNAAVNYNTINNAGGGGSAHGATLYGTFFSTVTGTGSFSNNGITLANSSSSTSYGMYNANTLTGGITINNNTFASGTLSSTGSVYLIYNSSATNTVTVNNNSTSGTFSRAGAGPIYCYYNFGNPTGGTETFSNNNFSNISGATTLYGYYSNTAVAQNRDCNGNTLSNWSSTGTNYCIYALSTLTNLVYNNTINDITNTSTGAIYGIYFTGTNPSVYGNLIYNLTVTSGTSLNGIQSAGTGTVNLYKNKIYGLTNNNSESTATNLVAGIHVSTNGTTTNIYNNLIGNITAPASISTEAIRGISLGSTAASTTLNIYYNTVYLNASSSGANFGSSGIYHTYSATSTSGTLVMRNNNIVNTSTAAGTGFTVAFRRSSATSLANYSSSSNNNNFYSSGYLFYDGTNSKTTLSDFKTWLAPGESSSVNENPSWQSTTGSSPDFLKFSTGSASQLESGAANVATYTDDYIGTIRAGNGGYAGTGTAPDIGAWELEGLPSDVTGPAISYTTLSNTLCSSNRSLSATITDGSGVETSSGLAPRIYYKKTTNANTWNDNTSGTDGWKYFESTTGSSPFSLTIDYSLVNGGVSAGDVIQYFVVAQDQAGTPNVGINSGTFNSAPSSVALTGSAFPIGGTINSYTISSGGLSGTVNVGPGETYETLSAAGGLFAAINAGGLTGNLTAEITGNITTEDGSVALNQINYGCSPPYTLTIKPAASTTPTVSGSSTGAIIKLNGADYVTIDGSNSGGSSRDLTIENTNTSSATAAIWISSTGAGAGATNNTVKNSIIKTGSNTVTTYGVCISGSTLTGTGADNNNNTIQNNWIQKATYGIRATGVTASGELAGLTITQNKIGGDASADYVTGYGIYMTGANAPVISLNEIYNMKVDGSKYGLWFGTTVHDAVISRNNIHGMGQTNTTSTYYCIGIYFSSSTGCSNNQLSNNIIYDLDQYGSTSDYYYCGIRIAGGTTYKLYYNTVSLTGAFASSTAAVFANCLFVSTASTSMDIRNNIFYNNRTGNAPKSYTIYTVSSTTYANINYNDYYSGGTALGMIGGTEVANLAALQAATTQDANSIGGDPLLNSATNMQPNLGSPVLAAADNSTGISIDYTGASRSGTTPTIGAYETAADGSGPTITYTALSGTLCSSNRSLSASITDGSGVNVSSGTAPRIYFKKSTNANTWNDNTSSTDGWKYFESTTGSSPFSFTIDYSLVNGGVSAGDVIQYFVVAQDLAGTPNVGINSGTFNSAPSSVALTGSAFPIGGTINSYTISSGGLSGTVNVGPGETYETLSAAGGLFAAINAGGLTGNLTAEITGNITTEDGTVALNQINYGCSPPYTLTIKPAASTTPTISGLSSGAIIKLNGADYVTIDGSNSGGSSQDLTISNLMTSASNSVIWLGSLGTGLGATNNTIKNCNISNASLTVSNYGIAVSDGTTIGNGGGDNDNVTIQNNSISYCATGVYANGSAAVSTGGMDNLTVSSNSITTNCSVASIGIKVGNALNATISQNTLDIQQSVNNAPVGISLETGVSNTTVSRNKITRVKYTGTTGYGGRGITVGTGSASSNITISNNVIYGVAGDNWSSFGGSSSAGIMIGVIGNSSTLTTTAGGINLYYNSVNMYDSYSRSATACITTALYVGSGASALDIRNNVFVNSMENTGGGTGSGSKAYAVYSAAANTAFTTMNYNDYYVSGAQGMLGFLGTDQANLAAWQTATAQDVNSISADPQFNSNTNLVPLSGSPLLAAATPIGTVTIDYTGASRSGTTPTIGAYESAGDFAGPTITYTALSNTCATSARTLTASITDVSGVPTSGIGLPVLYWRINAGSWNAATGTYVSGNNYDFTFGAGVVATDVVQYYIVAQDNAGTPNVSAYPSAGAGGFSINPPAASTAPTTPGSYTIQTTLAPGTYTVGTSGTYTTLTAAVAAYNTSCLTGPVVFELLDAGYTTAPTGSGETFPIVINANADASATNSLTIRPASGTAVSISGTSGATASALLKLNGAKYVTIDGLNSGGASLSIENTSTTAGTAVIWLSSSGTGLGANNNTIKNCSLKAGVSQNAATTSTYGLIIAGSTLSGTHSSITAGDDNDNNTIQGNTITKARYGIYIRGGSSTNPNTGNVITQNIVGPSSFGADEIGRGGIVVREEDGIQITRNEVRFVGGEYANTTSGFDRVGISLGNDAFWAPTAVFVKNANISRNTIHDIIEERTYSAAGIAVGAADGINATNNTVANNFIYNIKTNGTTGDQSIGIGLSAANGDKVVYNTIYMTGDTDPDAGATTPSVSNFGLSISSGTAVTNPVIKNNIVYMDLTSSSAPSLLSACINIPSSYSWGTGSSDYNNFYNLGSNTQARIGCVGGSGGTFYSTLAAWQTATVQDASSRDAAPVFVSATDLHLNSSSGNNCQLNGAGTPITGITTDYDNDSRDGSNPDIGADEVTISPVTTLAATAGGGQVCSNTTAGGHGIFYDASCQPIAKITPNGGVPVSGLVNTCVTIESSVLSHNGEPYVQRHFDMTPANNQTTATARITLFVYQAEFDAFNLANGSLPDLPTGSGDAAGIAALRVTKYSGNGTLPGTYTPGVVTYINPADGDIVWNGNYWEISFNVTGFSGFFIHSGPYGPLPASLLSFSGYKDGSRNQLKWTTGTELNNRGFEVQRSADGINYASIGFVNSLAPGGNSSDQLQYNFTDYAPAGDRQYYRLRQEDIDGRSKLSNIVLIKGNKPSVLAIDGLFPNPAQSQLNILLSAPNRTAATVLVTDMAGRTLQRKPVNLETGSNTVQLDVHSLAQGSYLLRLVCSDGCDKVMGKFVKQ